LVTKSKNKFLYIVVLTITSFFFASTIISAMDILKNRNYFKSDYYFSSNQFKSEVVNYLSNAIKLNTAINGNINDSDYNFMKKYLESMPAMKYYIVYNNGKTVFTNIREVSDINSYIKENSLYSLKFPAYIIGDNIYPQINYWFKNTNSEGYIVITNNTQGYNKIIEDNNYCLSIRQRIIKEAGICAVSMMATLILLILLYKRRVVWQELIKLYEKVPFDIRLFLFLIYSFVMLINIFNMSFFYKPIGLDHFLKLLNISIYAFYAIINVFSIPKGKTELTEQLETSMVFKFFKAVNNSFESKSINLKIRIIIILTIIFGISILGILFSIEKKNIAFFGIFFVYIILYMVFIPKYIKTNIRYLNKIFKGAEAITSGDLNYSIEELGRGDLFKLSKNINNMRKSFKNSLESEMKSERLKSELITNVSHDLKTPLTSIINYIDLLKNEEITKDERMEYISILDKKSQRLKIIIEDLFEASKIASGSVELNIEKIDVISLLNQSLAEFDEKIKNSLLQFRVNYPESKVYLNLDGKKTWRVFENLIGNILKYSQKNTRVYIDVLQKENKVYIIMKNVSAFELNFDVDEIFERFKRGDQSRSTEGSGLGLAIAKSIVELEGGRLTIQIDGDLFKSVIEFDV